jgi:simple sugar transport system ATP-binding protein
MNETLCDLRGVEKSFGDNRVLKGLNLSLPAGAVTVLMGANGAGKSTLVKILSGVHAAGCRIGNLLGKEFPPRHSLQKPSAPALSPCTRTSMTA